MLIITAAEKTYKYHSGKQDAEITLDSSNPKEFTDFLTERLFYLPEPQVEALAFIGRECGVTGAGDLIDISYNTDQYFLCRAQNYTELGNFALHQDTETPEHLKKFIDKEYYGVDFHGKQNGAFVSKGYIVSSPNGFTPAIVGSKLPDMLDDVECRLKIKLGNIGDEENAVWVKMPMSEEKSLALADRFGQWHECEIFEINSCLDLNYLPETAELEQLNELGAMLEAFGQSDLTKLYAVFEYNDGKQDYTSVADILNTVATIDCYEFDDRISDEYEHGKYAMENVRLHYHEDLEDYIDFEQYGKDMTSNERGEITTYGYLHLPGPLPDPQYASVDQESAMCQSM